MTEEKKKARKSSTGGVFKRVVDMTNWRQKMRDCRIKFDDKAKELFLTEYAETNNAKFSADAAGVCYNTVVYHLKNDPEFKDAYEEARQAYRDRCLKQAHKLIFEGVEEPIIGGKDRDQVVAFRVRYSEKLLENELKKMDPEYRERQEIDHKNSGGVLVVPAGQSPEDWIKSAQEENEVLTEPDKGL